MRRWCWEVPAGIVAAKQETQAVPEAVHLHLVAERIPDAGREVLGQIKEGTLGV